MGKGVEVMSEYFNTIIEFWKQYTSQIILVMVATALVFGLAVSCKSRAVTKYEEAIVIIKKAEINCRDRGGSNKSGFTYGRGSNLVLQYSCEGYNDTMWLGE